MTDQPSLFDIEPPLPEGFRYEPDFLDREEERALLARLQGLPFKAFELHGFQGRRRVVSFGRRYDFNTARLQEAPPIPEFLDAVRAKAARFAGVPANAIEQLLVTEYEPGAPIGWHRDRPMFADVIGVSLLASCRFRMRKRVDGGWARAALTLAPRSVYLLRGPARTEWEHSIPAVEALRYSLTFRTFRPHARP